MASDRYATRVFIYVCLSFSLPIVNQGASVYKDGFPNDDSGVRLTREYHLRQGALRGFIVKPSRQYDLQPVEIFLGIPYAAAPLGSLRFMPPVSAPPWPGLMKATSFAPVCPQALPPIKKGNPPSLGRQHYLNRLKPFLAHESEDCLYLNIYVPFREQKPKKFPVLVFIHGDSFEWSSGNPYDGRVLASYGNIMVITLNFRLGILGFMKPSLTEHVYGNNGLLDQLAALQWIKDNIEDLNGDPHSVTLMGHGTGAACVNYLMLSPISNGLFHRAILMSGSALSNWAITKDPTQYTLQVAQSLGCNPTSKNLMTCLQQKPLSEVKKVQILAREFETPLGPIVAGSFIPNEPAKTMESYPNLLSKYQILSGVTEIESYHDFGVIELDHGILENQRDDFIKKYCKLVFGGADDIALREILKQYAPSKLDPQRWSVEANRDVILNFLSDADTLAPTIRFANYQSKANRQSYFYVFGHNSVSTEYAPLNKSVHGEEMPYVLGVPLGGANTHFHTEYTQKEKLLSEAMMRLWTNFVKMGTPNTQSVNVYYTLDKKQWSQFNVEWPEYNVLHQSYLKLDIPPYISSLYRTNYSDFWIEALPNKMRKYVVDPLFEYTPIPTTVRPKSHRPTDSVRHVYQPRGNPPPRFHSGGGGGGGGGSSGGGGGGNFGRLQPYSPPAHKPDTEMIYRQIQSIKTPSRPVPPGLMEKPQTTTARPKATINMPVKTSSATITLIISLGVLFLAVNVGICSILYFKKRKLRLREQAFESSRHSRAEIGDIDVVGQKSSKDDKSALKTFKDSCSVIKSISINKIRKKSKKGKKKFEPCKTPKSDDSGGFRERFQLRRHLSTSTLDAHTKVRDWIANEVMHRCSPNILRKSNSDLNTEKQITVAKPFTRSEELLSDSNKTKKDTLKVEDNMKSRTLQSKTSHKTKTSEKTTSTSALGSHSSIGSNKQSINSTKQTAKSSESVKSKGTESTKSRKVSVAIDATPSARTNSILSQEPIEITKSLDCTDSIHSKKEKSKLSKSEGDYDIVKIKPEKQQEKTFTNVVTLSLGTNTPLKIAHKHSSSDPVTDVNYDKLKEKYENSIEILDIPPPAIFRNEINVTSRDENLRNQPLTAAEALLTIQRRKFPKVLPDLPKSQKRLSLQPTAFQTFRNMGSIESQSERSKIPPQPPPRTTTLERRIAYKNSKPLSSFDGSHVKKISETCQNYENISKLLPTTDFKESNKTFGRSLNDKPGPTVLIASKERGYPKVIIASSDMLTTKEPNVFIKPSLSQTTVSSNVPRVRLPDDFHSGSVTSFSSFCSEDDDDDDDDDLEDNILHELAEDQLIKELVGGVESPTNMEDVLDSKGPETIFEKKLEIVPVQINRGHIAPKNKEDYVCITDLQITDVSDFEKTAQIKPNFGLNKLQHRSESINTPLEKAMKVKPKKSMKPTILTKSIKSKRSSHKSKDLNKLEHSNSNSSNDTETSTGTVRHVEMKTH